MATSSATTALSEDINLIPFTYPCLFYPVLDKLEAKNEPAVRTIRSAMEKVEAKQPGFLLSLTKELLKRSKLDSKINLQEAFLRQQADTVGGFVGLGAKMSGHGKAPTGAAQGPFLDLSHRAASLQKILARIPDEMSDRREFLETIKDIASCIKKILDATNALFDVIPDFAKPAVESRKRDFVKYSKRFSNTLKDYFKGEPANLVFISANQLIYQTGLIVKTIRELDL